MSPSLRALPALQDDFDCCNGHACKKLPPYRLLDARRKDRW